jgi:hypothetical protein
MAGTPTNPAQSKPIVKGNQAFTNLSPMAGMTQQDTSPYQSPWLQVPEGTVLVLVAAISALTGLLLIEVETASSATPADSDIRPLGSFPCPSAPGSIERLFGPSDSWVRVSATPGIGGAQVASWNVNGRAFFDYARQQ